MGRLNKRKAHLSDLRNAKRQQLLAQQSLHFSENALHAVHWERFSEDEESDIEISDIDDDFFDEADITVDKFIENIQLSWKSEAENTKFLYQRGNQLSQRQAQRRKLHKLNLIKHAQQHSQPLQNFFSNGNNNNSEVSKSEKNIVLIDRQEAIKDLEKFLKLKKKNNLNCKAPLWVYPT
jgi:lipopolysaccharide export LptBFGC system permease protein LptF